MFTRPPIREALADDAFHRAKGARLIVDAKCNTIAVSEIKFSEIAMQVFFGAMLINALHAAFENRIDDTTRDL